jgi:hypothetical protein
LEGLDLVGRIILKLSSRNRIGKVEQIDLARNRDKWLAFVRTEINLRFP